MHQARYTILAVGRVLEFYTKETKYDLPSTDSPTQYTHIGVILLHSSQLHIALVTGW